jgi:predicted nicotinamide N-methyase
MSDLVDRSDDDDDDELPQLSMETLNALRQFAVETGVSGVFKDNDDEDEHVDIVSSVRSHFELKDRDEIFDVSYEATDDSKRKVAFKVKGLKRELGQTLSSTGLTIWRAAEHLCQFIIDNPDRFNDKAVCELGAGLGLNSIMIEKCCTCSELVSTDGCEDTVKLLIDNKIDNDCFFSTSYLWWGEHEDFLSEYPTGFDVLVAADVIYEEEQIEPLLSTVSVLLRESGEFLLAFCRRNVPIDKVLTMASERYAMEWIKIENTRAPSEEPIFSIRKKRKS